MRSLSALLAPVLLAGCTTLAPAAPEVAAPGDPAAPALPAGPQRQGALDLAKILDADAGPARNLFYSPASIEQAFGLVALGAGGATRSQIEAVLPPPRDPKGLASDGGGVEVRLANALWLSDRYRFRDSYVAATARDYGATAERLDFARPADVAERINTWADKATEGLIPAILSPEDVTPDARAFLTNALYFDGLWEHPFDGWQDEPFLFGSGEERPFRLMREVMTVPLVRDGGLVAVRLPYTNPRYAMDVIIPEKRAVMASAPSSEVLTGLASKLGASAARLVEVRLPQFEIATDMALVQPLTAIGLTLPFDPNRADLSLMSEPGEAPLSIDEVRQMAKLQVFDTGTRAAAVTSVRIVTTGARILSPTPIPFVVDRPFVVVLRDLERGEVLFLGRIADPQPFTPTRVDE